MVLIAVKSVMLLIATVFAGERQRCFALDSCLYCFLYYELQ